MWILKGMYASEQMGKYCQSRQSRCGNAAAFLFARNDRVDGLFLCPKPNEIEKRGDCVLRVLALIAAVAATAPIRIFLRLDVNERPTFRAVVFLYGFRMNLDGRIGKGGAISLWPDGDANAEVSAPLASIWPFAQHMLRRVELRGVSVRCKLGTGDACSTALYTSLLSTVLRSVGARFGARVSVEPRYGDAYFALTMRCILHLRAGDIMIAGMAALRRRMSMMRKEGNANGSASH